MGAVVGAGLVKLALPSERQGDLTVSHLPPNTSAGQVCLVEVVSYLSITCALFLLTLYIYSHVRSFSFLLRVLYFFYLQMMMTFGQVFASFGTAFDPRGWGRLGPVAIALIFGLNIHAGAISSCSSFSPPYFPCTPLPNPSVPAMATAWMNPARAFGPAVVEWRWDDHCMLTIPSLSCNLPCVVGVCSFHGLGWLLAGVWWVGPIVGGVVAGVTYEYLFMQRKHGRCALPPPQIMGNTLDSSLYCAWTHQAKRSALHIRRQPPPQEEEEAKDKVSSECGRKLKKRPVVVSYDVLCVWTPCGVDTANGFDEDAHVLLVVGGQLPAINR